MGVVAGEGRVRARKGSLGPGGGGSYVSVLQRVRLLDATIGLVCEVGARQVTVRRVVVRAGVSSKTFYDLFADRDECLLAAFDYALEQFVTVAVPAYALEGDWVARVRSTLDALLVFLEAKPLLRRFVFVEVLACGPLVLERRARVIQALARVIDEGRADTKAGRELPSLTAEGVVAAVWGVIHARLLDASPGPLVELLNPLMATIVLPYRGGAAATRELSRPGASKLPAGEDGGISAHADGSGELPFSGSDGSSVAPVDFRPTLRTLTVLSAIAERAGLNNREVSEHAGIVDQGQMSRLLWRLEDLGLVQNTGGRTQGTPKAWSLTPLGEQALHASRPHSARANGAHSTGGEGVAAAGPMDVPTSVASSVAGGV